MVKIRCFVAVDDCGNIINPMIVDARSTAGSPWDGAAAISACTSGGTVGYRSQRRTTDRPTRGWRRTLAGTGQPRRGAPRCSSPASPLKLWIGRPDGGRGTWDVADGKS